MKKDSFEKKLAAYIAVSAAFLATQPKANAQIIYTDVNPDFVSNNGSYYLDLNNDGIVDFNLNAETSSFYTSGSSAWSASFYIKLSLQSIGVNKALSDSLQLPLQLNNNDTISPINQWGIGQILYRHNHHEEAGGWPSNNSTSFNSTQGNWTNTNEKFLGLKITAGGNNYYGWARLVIDGYHLTLKDYAYYNIPDHQILAGETICNSNQPTLLSSPIDSICIGESVTLQVSNYQGDTVHWFRNGILLPNNSIQISVNQSGNYYAIIGYINCSSETTNTVSITLIAPPAIPVITQQNDSLITQEVSGYHYQWFYGTYPIPNSDFYFIVPQWAGNYHVVITDQIGCSASSVSFPFIIEGINSLSSLSENFIFTTNQHQLNLIYLPEQLVSGEIKIFDINGKLLIENTLMNSSEQIPISNFSAGIYFFEIRKDEMVLRKKFLVN